MTRQRLFLHVLRCTECGTTFPIQRPAGRRRGPGHVKHLWCRTCQRRTGHVEEEQA